MGSHRGSTEDPEPVSTARVNTGKTSCSRRREEQLRVASGDREEGVLQVSNRLSLIILHWLLSGELLVDQSCWLKHQ